MKTNLTNILAIAAIAAMPTLCMAQNENPRGVYKLTGLLDKYGNVIKEPFDQYKICTDSVTMMLSVQGTQFFLGMNDKEIFNYTGDTPDANDATATRIFDSNAEHFTLKWWSTTPGHLYFPHNDWCTEYYESGKYSENGKLIVEALMSPPAKDPKNPLFGTWRLIGMVDELRDMKKELKRIREKPLTGIYSIFPPTTSLPSAAMRAPSILRPTLTTKRPSKLVKVRTKSLGSPKTSSLWRFTKTTALTTRYWNA